MSNLDTRIANPDQLLTTDIDKFCESCTDLYSNIAKPLLDISIYVYRLTSTLGGQVCKYIYLVHKYCPYYYYDALANIS